MYGVRIHEREDTLTTTHTIHTVSSLLLGAGLYTVTGFPQHACTVLYVPYYVQQLAYEIYFFEQLAYEIFFFEQLASQIYVMHELEGIET